MRFELQPGEGSSQKGNADDARRSGDATVALMNDVESYLDSEMASAGLGQATFAHVSQSKDDLAFLVGEDQ